MNTMSLSLADRAARIPGPKTRVPETKATVPSLVQPAPLTLLCMSCRTIRCATPDGIVIWHPDTPGSRRECAGAGAPGLLVCAHCWQVPHMGWKRLPDGAQVCQSDREPADCYRYITIDGEPLGARREA